MQTLQVALVLLLLGLVSLGTTNGKRKNGCKYKRGSWTECNAETNTMTMTKTLKEGSGAECEATKTKTKDCTENQQRQSKCKYRKTEWSECDEATKVMARTRNLKGRSPSSCLATITETKTCAQGGGNCKYSNSAFSACANGKMSRTMNLKQSKSDSDCESTITHTRSCQ